jgi:hypothetical protein
MDFTRKTLTRAAAIFAVLYAVCVLAPVAAGASSHSDGAAHCLTTSDHGLANGDFHNSGVEHQHIPTDTGDQDSNQAATNCCGLFCVTGLTSVHAEFLPGRFPDRIARLQSYLPLVERGPERHYKPPISLLS